MLWKRQFPSPGTCLAKTGTLSDSLSLSTRRRSLLLPLRMPPRPPPPPRPVPASYVGPRLPLPGTPRVRVRQEAVRIDLRGGIPRRMEVGGGMGMMMCSRFAAPAAAVAGLQRAVGGGGRRAAVMVVGVAIVGPRDGGMMMLGANFVVAAYPRRLLRGWRIVEDAPGCEEQDEPGIRTEERRGGRRIVSSPGSILSCEFPYRIWRHGGEGLVNSIYSKRAKRVRPPDGQKKSWENYDIYIAPNLSLVGMRQRRSNE